MLLSKFRSFIKGTDKVLFPLCLAASAFGAVMVYSATLSGLKDGQVISGDLLTMLIAITLGIALCITISVIDYKIVLRLWPVVAAVCLLLMFLLFFIGVGPDARSDSKVWLKIAGKFTFQPSELLKIGFIITFALHLDAVKENINRVKILLPVIAHGLFPVALVILTGDLGSALVFIAIFLTMLFLAKVKIGYFAAGGILGLAALPLLWTKAFSGFQMQRNRLLAVYFPQQLEESVYKTLIYQQMQSVNAIGSGGLRGKGLFQGTYTQNGLIPVDESDMIFAVVGEELGLIGCVLLLLILTAIIIRIARVGYRSNDFIGTLICYAVAAMIGAQAIINIGMCLKLLPCIGITFPFMSAGGSSNLCIYIGIGFIMSIYRSSVDRAPVNFRLSRIRTPFSD